MSSSYLNLLRIVPALAIRRGILEGALKDLEPSIASHVMLLNVGRDECTDAGAQNAWKIAAQNISDRTAAFLSAAELEPVWKKITSSACYLEATTEQKKWVGLFAAIARRNSSDIAKFGRDLIGSLAPITEADLAYLTTVTAAANIRMGQLELARSVLKEQLKKLNPSESYWFPLSNLLALTEPRRAALAPAGQDRHVPH